MCLKFVTWFEIEVIFSLRFRSGTTPQTLVLLLSCLYKRDSAGVTFLSRTSIIQPSIQPQLAWFFYIYNGLLLVGYINFIHLTFHFCLYHFLPGLSQTSPWFVYPSFVHSLSLIASLCHLPHFIIPTSSYIPSLVLSSLCQLSFFHLYPLTHSPIQHPLPHSLLPYIPSLIVQRSHPPF